MNSPAPAESTRERVLIIGGGFCGLAAAIELGRMGVDYVLAEKSGAVGGLSPTLHIGDTAFELGPHIYFDKDPEVTAFWRGLIGERLRRHHRRTRIFYRGKYIKSPLSILDVMVKLGPLAVTKIILSFVGAKLRRREIVNAEDWVVANFGRELYRRFFKVYNEKIWGIPSSGIASDWAGQRIKSSLLTMVVKSVVRDPAFIVKTFDFPVGGSQEIYAAQEAIIRADPHGDLRLGCAPARIARVEGGFDVTFDGRGERVERFTHVISTIHLADLGHILDYPGKDAALLQRATDSLVYRNLVLVNLVLPAGQVRSMDEHWIDIHDPAVTALRVTNFSNYSDAKGTGKVALGVEYNCFGTDSIWSASGDEIVAIALRDLKTMRLVDAAPEAFQVQRIARAYPVYASGYSQFTNAIFGEFAKAEGLILAGRNAMFKWNNMHHSVKTGLMAARNVRGAGLDLASVKGNVTIGKDSD